MKKVQTPAWCRNGHWLFSYTFVDAKNISEYGLCSEHVNSE